MLCDPVGRGLTARGWRYKKQTRVFHQPNPPAAKNVVNPLFDREIYVLQTQRNTFDISREMCDTKSGVVQQKENKTLSSGKLSVRKEVGDTTFRQGYKWKKQRIKR